MGRRSPPRGFGGADRTLVDARSPGKRSTDTAIYAADARSPHHQTASAPNTLPEQLPPDPFEPLLKWTQKEGGRALARLWDVERSALAAAGKECAEKENAMRRVDAMEAGEPSSSHAPAAPCDEDTSERAPPPPTVGRAKTPPPLRPGGGGGEDDDAGMRNLNNTLLFSSYGIGTFLGLIPIKVSSIHEVAVSLIYDKVR